MTGRALERYLAQHRGEGDPFTDEAGGAAAEPVVVAALKAPPDAADAIASYLNAAPKAADKPEGTAEISCAEILALLHGPEQTAAESAHPRRS